MKHDLSKAEYKLFQDFIHENSGIYLDDNKLDSLKASLLDRMLAKGVQNYGEYYNLLKFHPDGAEEFRELLTLITINETCFFRYPSQFAVLKDYVLPQYIREKERKDQNISIWSTGCSTGEEPYSVAMIILDLVDSLDSWNIEILATDINKRALAEAREGIYSKRSIRLVNQEYRDKYFRILDDGFKLSDEIKRMVTFRYFNLMDEPYPLPQQGNWNIIFCRNVTIYFKIDSTRRVIQKFHDILNEGGYLFTGHSETLHHISDDFSFVEVGGAFVYRKKMNSSQRMGEKRSVFNVNIDAPRSGKLTAPVWVDASANLRQTLESIAKKSFPKHLGATKGKSTQDVTIYQPGQTKPLPDVEDVGKQPSKENTTPSYKTLEAPLEEAINTVLEQTIASLEVLPNDPRLHLLAGKLYADKGMYDKAVHECEKAIQLDVLLLEAYFMLGIIYNRLNKIEQALSALRKCIYINADFALAHFNLACIYESNGKPAEALREYNNVIRKLRMHSDDRLVEFSDELTNKLLIETCEKNIERLKKYVRTSKEKVVKQLKNQLTKEPI